MLRVVRVANLLLSAADVLTAKVLARKDILAASTHVKVTI